MSKCCHQFVPGQEAFLYDIHHIIVVQNDHEEPLLGLHIHTKHTMILVQ